MQIYINPYCPFKLQKCITLKSSNDIWYEIQVIPGNLIKKLDWDTDQQLNVSENPLTQPPLDVCECGLRSIMQYFQEAKSDMKVYQGLKVSAMYFLVGHYDTLQCKTGSLLSLVSQCRILIHKDFCIPLELIRIFFNLSLPAWYALPVCNTDGDFTESITT